MAASFRPDKGDRLDPALRLHVHINTLTVGGIDNLRVTVDPFQILTRGHDQTSVVHEDLMQVGLPTEADVCWTCVRYKDRALVSGVIPQVIANKGIHKPDALSFTEAVDVWLLRASHWNGRQLCCNRTRLRGGRRPRYRWVDPYKREGVRHFHLPLKCLLQALLIRDRTSFAF